MKIGQKVGQGFQVFMKREEAAVKRTSRLPGSGKKKMQHSRAGRTPQ
ncbi:hypothetical protein [Siminovitchia fordii]|nr:hypothetical protein [Siminovitchia fordii]